MPIVALSAPRMPLLNNQRMQVVWAVSFYWIVSISLVFLNKDSMNRLDAPLFITWTQLLLAVVLCFALSKLRRSVAALSFFPEFQIRLDVALKVLPLTFAFIFMITFNNLCLKYVNVAFYQVARSLTIVFNVIFTYCFMGQTTSKRALSAVATVIIGYIIGSSAELSLMTLSVTGSVYGVLASVFVSLYSISVKRVLGAVDNNKWVLMIYNNVIACVLMPPLIFFFNEIPILTNSVVLWSPRFWMSSIGMAGLFGFLINIATYAQIQVTSPLTHNISGTAKAGFQTLMALVLLREPISVEGFFGLMLVLGGSSVYGYVRDQEMSASVSGTAGSKAPYEAVKQKGVDSIDEVDREDVELGETKADK